MTPGRSINRRQFLTFGTVALGSLAVPGFAAARAVRARAKSVILLYMDGGPSHIDMWDLKPDAPEEIRGDFKPIATSVPGIHVCEHLPLVARQMHLLAQVRSVRHNEAVHDPAVYQMLTGHQHLSSAGGLTVQPNDFPHMATAFGKLDRTAAVMPKVFELPETMKMDARVLPGQNAGFLGAVNDPMRVNLTPEAKVVPPEFDLRDDITAVRLGRRTALLDQLESKVAALDAAAGSADFERFQQQAFKLLSQPSIKHAFDLEREPAAVRQRYGLNRHGQSVLLARRLVESGACFVTVYWGKEQQDWADGKGLRPANNPWDTHRNHFPLLKNELIPRADCALAALLEDMHHRGLLSQTLIVWMGDFGRTPRIDRKYASRDHWPQANTVLLAGAGVRGGTVLGKTDRHGAYVTEDPVSPADLTATIFQSLGVDPHTTVHDGQGRPFSLSEGRCLDRLW